MGDLRQAGFEGPVHQVIGILRRHDARQPQFFGQAHKFHQAPGMFIGDADIPDLAFADQFGERFQLFANRRCTAFGRGVELPLPEHRLVALRPVQLIKVDIVSLQSAQRAFDGGANIGAVERRRAVTDPGQAARRSGDLGSEDDLVALVALEPVADDGFGGAISFGAGRYRIHFGGVDEIHTLRQRVVKLGMGIGLAGLFAESHRAEADFRNEQIAAAKRAGIEGCHGCLHFCCYLRLTADHAVNQDWTRERAIKADRHDRQCVLCRIAAVLVQPVGGSPVSVVKSGVQSVQSGGAYRQEAPTTPTEQGIGVEHLHGIASSGARQRQRAQVETVAKAVFGVAIKIGHAPF